VQAVLLPVEDDAYALPVEWVRQVVAAPAVTPLVTAPSMVLGLFNLRGEIVPLLDTAALLGIGRVDTIAFAVVVNTPQGPAGLATTGTPERIVLDTATVASELPGTAGVFHVGGRVVVLIDPAVLLGAERLGGADIRALPAEVA
jgi:chemotaxis signal transduction protein